MKLNDFLDKLTEKPVNPDSDVAAMYVDGNTNPSMVLDHVVYDEVSSTLNLFFVLQVDPGDEDMEIIHQSKVALGHDD